MNTCLLEQISAFDGDKAFKNRIDRTMVLLQKFRTKYPFDEKPDLIDTLSGDDIFNESAGNVGDFSLDRISSKRDRISRSFVF
jgi:hypothetical protein